MDAQEPFLPWRRRADLLVRQQGTAWVLKDPITQRFFQLGSEAYFVWQGLNGRRSAASLCADFEQRFAPRLLTRDELLRFIRQLVGQGLVWGDNPGATAVIEQRRSAAQGLQAWSRLTNLLAIRFRGVDPHRSLTWLTTWFGWIFAPSAIVAGGLLILSAILLWLVKFEDLNRRLPEELAQWSVADAGSLALVLALLKILHELGHGIACRRLGGEVRELGVMLLVFTPCLYCNVSDAWLLPSRWQRMGISAAGMWVESVIAAVCFWIWYASPPGPFHALCLQVVFISAASTLFFNLNPLLRYDGYFLLADAWGIPNLQQRASAELTWRVRRCLGFEGRPPEHTTASSGFWLATYAACSFVYRLAMLAAILWFLDHWLEPQGLRLLAQTISGLTLLALATGPVMWLAREARQPGAAQRWWPVHPWRLIGASALLIGLLFLPLPGRVIAPAVLMPAAARGVFVTMEGRLTELIPAGTPVAAGDVIARLENPPLQRELRRLQGEVDRLQQVARSLQLRQLHDPNAGLQLPATERQLREITAQLAQRRTDAERLTIVAPADGLLWPAAPLAPQPITDQLAHWQGSPFDRDNQGCWLAAGTQLGWVGSAQGPEALALVTQTDLQRLRVGQSAYVIPESATASGSWGQIAEISDARLAAVSPDSLQRWGVPSVARSSGSQVVGTWHQVRIPLSETYTLPAGLGIGTAAIHVPGETVLGRLQRGLQELFSTGR